MKPATWRALLAGGATAKQDELVSRLSKFEAWAKEQIAEAREYVRPDFITHPLLDEIQAKNRTAYLVQLRLLNHVLRRLNGETPTYGCETCVWANACFDGSVECKNREHGNDPIRPVDQTPFVIDDGGPVVCAGCGAPGFFGERPTEVNREHAKRTNEDPRALHWEVRGARVCIVCFNKEQTR